MTENKRYSFNWKNGHPNFWDNHCDLADCYLTCGDVVNILNELNDENKELKLQLEAFKDKLCELGVSDVKLYGKRYYTGLEEWLE